jgi:hypothetical protein
METSAPMGNDKHYMLSDEDAKLMLASAFAHASLRFNRLGSFGYGRDVAGQRG